MNKAQKNTLYFILFVAFLSMIFASVFNKINNVNRDKNLYNIGNIQEINNDIVTNGVAIFDEYVLENFSGIDISTDNSRVYRADSVIEGTNNFEATDNANKLYNLSNSLKISDSLNNTITFRNIKSKIFSGQINELDINYYNNINYSVETSENTIDYIENYIKNKAIKVDSSGYLLNYYDGFESLIGYNDISDSNWDFLKYSTNNNSSKIAGLKFVNNKHYYIATYLDKLYDLNKSNLTNAFITINNKNYRATLQDYISYKDGYIILFKMSDGLEKFIENRFFTMNINFGFKQGYKIPKEALISINKIKGVYYLENNIVKFTPVSIIKEIGNEVYISNDFDDIFPNVISKSQIDFSTLNPFTKIILNPENYKEGSMY